MLNELLDRLNTMLGRPTLTLRFWAKFDSITKCWVRVANNSIALKCWMKGWVVTAPKLTFLASRMLSPLKNGTLFAFSSWFPFSSAQLLHTVFKS